MGELRKRVIAGICLAPLIIAAFFFLPKDMFFLFLVFVSLLAIFEVLSINNLSDRFFIMFLAIFSSIPLYLKSFEAYLLWILLSALIYIIIKMFFLKDGGNNINVFIIKGTAILIFCEVFIVLPLIYFYFLKVINPYLPLVVLFSIWASDICAYFFGKTFGKRLLVPHISPKKTYAGLAGAIIGSMIVIVVSYNITGMGIAESLFVGAMTGLLGQVGDIFESIVKRVNEVKDSSALIPGHGGILDRIDSFIFTTPFLYHYLAGVKL